MTKSIWDDEAPSTQGTRSIWDEDTAASAPKERPSRNLFAVANDAIVDVANAGAGLVKAGSDLISPGNPVSEFIDKHLIKGGEANQSDFKKVGRENLARNLAAADGQGEKVKAYLQHAAGDPLEVVAQGVGSAGVFGLLGKIGLGTRAIMAAAGGAGAGEVRGNIYDKIQSKTDAELTEASPEYAELRKTMSEADAKKEIGTKLVRHLPELAAAAAAGALGGKYGAEAIAAGTRVAKSRLGAAAVSAVDEAAQGAVEQIATNVGVKRTDAKQSIWDDVALNAVQEGLPGGVTGIAGHRGSHAPAPVADPVQQPAAVAQAQPAAPVQKPGMPTASQALVRNAFADVMGDESVLQQRQATQGLVALSLSQIEQQDGEEALVRAIEHLSAGDAEQAEQLYEASQSEDLVAAGRSGLAGNAMDFIQINDGIRSELGLGQEEQASTQPGEAVPAAATQVEQVAPEAMQVQVDAVRQGLVTGAVISPAAAETLDVNGLQLAEVIGADGQPRYVVARDVETVQQAVARSFEVGPDQMAAELFAPAQGKAVVQQIDPTTGEVAEEAVVSPSEVDAARDRTGSRSTHVRPVADVLAERLPAAPEAQSVAATGADEQPAPLSRFFSRAKKAPSAPAQFEPTEPSGHAEAFVESLNKGLRLQGDSAVDPASIVEVKPSRELAKMGSAIKAMFGTNVVFVHTPKGLVRKNGEVFNRFHGAASGDKNTLFLNVESDHALSTLGHELAHVLEQQHPDIYEKLEITVLSRMRAGAARELQGLLAQAAQAESLDKGALAAQFRKEVVADAIGEMANDETFWKDVFSNVGRERTLAKQLYDAVLDVIAKLQRALTRGGYIKGVKDVAQVKKAIQSAYKEWAQRYETQGEDIKHLTPEEAGMYAELLAHAARDEAIAEEKSAPKTEKPARPAKPAPVTDNQPATEKVEPEPKSEQAEQPAEQPAAAAAAEPAPGSGGAGGAASQVAVDSRTQPGTRGGSLEGLAAEVRVNGQLTKFGGFKPAQQAARKYAAKAGIKYAPPKKYVTVDPTRAKRIADAFEAMPHNPTDPEVKASYDAMIKETIAQWEAIKATGLKVEFITGEDPYGNPRNAIIDVVQNNHLWVFPTSEGFGGTESAGVDISGNPLLAVVPGETISGRPVQANDIFRIVHDYFGHIKEGVGFRADGEENAWRAHMAMYSPLARKAATTETRGQNSWVNFGPFAEQNRTANGVETQYAPQKIGLLPDWVVEDGRTDEPYVQPKPVKRDAPVEPAEPEDIPEEAFVEEEEAPDAPVSFSRNPLKMESVQEALDFTSTTKLPYQLGDALDRGQWADAYVLAKDPAERKQLLANLGTKLVELFADSKVRLSKWIAGLPIADVTLLQRLEGDLRRSDTVRSDLEGYVKEKFTEPMMAAITKASKQTKLSSDQVKKLAGYWMAARYAPEASAQLIAKDRTALALAQASGDTTAIAQAQQNLNDRILSVNGNIGDAKVRGVAGGMNNAEAAQLVQNVEAKIPVQLLEDIAKPIYAMLDWKKQRDLATGKVTQTQVNSWLNSPRYVPLTGDPRADRETTDVFSAGGQLNQDQDHAMNGRKDSVADDGIDAAFTATIKTINFTAMQDFKRSLNKVYEHAQASGLDIGLTREAVTGIVRTGDDVVIYRDTQKRANGSEFTAAHAFRFKDQRIIEALKKDNVEHLNSALKVISAPTRWYARAVTQFMPMFAPINLVRDIWERSEVLRTKVIYAADGSVVDVKKAARSSIADVINPALWKASMMKAFKRGGMTPVRGELEEMIRLGGSSTTGDFLDRSSGDLEATIRGDASKLGHAANKTLEVVTRWNDIFEVIPSLAIYRSLKDQGVKAEDAAAAVLDLMNFRKKGTVMPAVRAFYVFAQPAATSGYNLAKYLSTSTGRKRFAAQALIATALYAMLRGAWGDDEDEELGNKLDNLSNYTVERSIPIKVGDYVVKLPVGFGPPQLAWATGGIVNRFASGRYSAGDAVGELAKGWTKSFVPVAPSDMELSKRPVDWFISTFTPTIAKPLFNIYADQTSFGAPLTPAFKNSDKLKADQAKRTTPQAYSDVAKQVYEMTGVDLYPDHIKALSDGYLVGPIREILSLTIEADAKAMRGEPNRLPLVSSFVDVINDRSILNQIHSRVRADLDANHRTITHLRETGDEDGKITPKMEDMERAYKRFMAAEKVLGMQRSALKKMDLDDEERAERTRSIEERSDQEHRRLLVEYLGS